MPLSPEERAAISVDEFRRSSCFEELRGTLTAQIAEAVAEERREVRATLRLSVVVLNQILTLTSLPAELGVLARVCRGLCLESLEEASPQGSNHNAATCSPPSESAAATGMRDG